MRYILYILVSASLWLPQLTSAEEPQPLENQNASAEVSEAPEKNAGITPESRWYFLDRLGERLNLALTFGREKKMEKMLRLADERLQELQKIAEGSKKSEALEKTLERYNDLRAKAESHMDAEEEAPSDRLSPEAKARREERLARMRKMFAEKITEHRARLEAQQDILPEAVRERVREAREQGIERLENVMDKLGEEAKNTLKSELEKRHEQVKERVIREREERRAQREKENTQESTE